MINMNKITKVNNIIQDNIIIILPTSRLFHSSSHNSVNKGKVKWTAADSVDPLDGVKSDKTEMIKLVVGDNENDLKEYFDAKERSVKKYYHNSRTGVNPHSEDWAVNKDVENNELFEIWKSRETLLPKEAASYYPKGHPKNPISNIEQSSSLPSSHIGQSSLPVSHAGPSHIESGSLPVSDSGQNTSLPANDLTVSQSNILNTRKRERSYSSEDEGFSQKREKITSSDVEASSTRKEHVSQVESNTGDDSSVVESVMDIVKDLF